MPTVRVHVEWYSESKKGQCVLREQKGSVRVAVKADPRSRYRCAYPVVLC